MKFYQIKSGGKTESQLKEIEEDFVKARAQGGVFVTDSSTEVIEFQDD